MLHMERKSTQSFIVKKDDFIRLGVTVEKLCNKLIELDYGEYAIGSDDLFRLPALLIIDGMQDWQEKHNIGIHIRVIGEGFDYFEIYDLKEYQDKINRQIASLDL